MGKGTRNRKFRMVGHLRAARQGGSPKGIARSLRRNGRMPLEKRQNQR